MNLDLLEKTRYNMLKMLKERDIDVSGYENFSQDELKKMLHESLSSKSFITPEPGPLDMILKNRNGSVTYVKYRLDKIKTARAVESFINQIYESQLTEKDKLLLIAPDEIHITGSSFETMLNNFYNQKGYFVQIIGLPQLVINIVEHVKVPKHKVITEEEKQELLKKYNLTQDKLPRISRDDPMAKYLGMVPGEVVKILRSSPASGSSEYYRLCF
jgi:DNA-directed RNA polymerase subunit H (RpoH/RPB5)